MLAVKGSISRSYLSRQHNVSHVVGLFWMVCCVAKITHLMYDPCVVPLSCTSSHRFLRAFSSFVLTTRRESYHKSRCEDYHFSLAEMFLIHLWLAKIFPIHHMGQLFDVHSMLTTLTIKVGSTWSHTQTEFVAKSFTNSITNNQLLAIVFLPFSYDSKRGK